MNIMQMQDAPQRAFGFLIQQATRIEAQVYRTVYQEIQYQDVIPVDTTGPEWVDAITYFSSDAVGQAQWFTGFAQDVPNVELLREKFTTGVSMASIGYRYSMEELGKALLYGIDLTSDKAVASRRVAEEFIDKVAFVGDATKGYTGAVNNASVTATTAPADGTASATTFASKTPDQILRDINGQLTGQFTGTYGNLVADTILLPYDILLNLSTRRIDTVNQTTILQWLKANNIYTLTTGRELTIRGLLATSTPPAPPHQAHGCLPQVAGCSEAQHADALPLLAALAGRPDALRGARHVPSRRGRCEAVQGHALPGRDLRRSR
jgi:hypothetical protein